MPPDDSAKPKLLEGERRKSLYARDVINSLINLHAIASSSKFNFTEKTKKELTDEDLLNDPQMAGEAKTQDEIDALFNSLD